MTGYERRRVYIKSRRERLRVIIRGERDVRIRVRVGVRIRVEDSKRVRVGKARR